MLQPCGCYHIIITKRSGGQERSVFKGPWVESFYGKIGLASAEMSYVGLPSTWVPAMMQDQKPSLGQRNRTRD